MNGAVKFFESACGRAEIRMNGWSELNRIASRRGDGLLPELRAMLDGGVDRDISNVVDLAAAHGDVWRQAGPPPISPLPARVPGNVTPISGFRAAARSRTND